MNVRRTCFLASHMKYVLLKTIDKKKRHDVAIKKLTASINESIEASYFKSFARENYCMITIYMLRENDFDVSSNLSLIKSLDSVMKV